MPDAWVDFPLFSSGQLDLEPLVPSVPQAGRQAGTQTGRVESLPRCQIRIGAEHAQRTTHNQHENEEAGSDSSRVDSIREDESIARLDI